MRIGYGYRRTPADFSGVNVEKVYIDHPGTDRAERSDMLRYVLREGDTLVLLRRGDLGAGGEIPMIEQHLVGMDIAVEVADVAPVERGTPGRKPAFDPNTEQDKKIKRLWHDPRNTQKYVLDRASEIMGHEVKRHHLTHRYKARIKK
jgi:hypothetical protein